MHTRSIRRSPRDAFSDQECVALRYVGIEAAPIWVGSTETSMLVIFGVGERGTAIALRATELGSQITLI